MSRPTKKQVRDKVMANIANKRKRGSITPGIIADVILDAIEMINVQVVDSYKLDGTTITGPDKTLNIEEGVTSIGDSETFRLFSDRGYTNLTLPSTLEYISGEAFKSNDISEITIPENVSVIREAAFDRNSITNLTFEGNDPISISYGAFANNNLNGTITIKSNWDIEYPPESWKSGVFSDNDFEGVIFEEGITTIGGFTNNRNLTSVTVPSTATEVHLFGFRYTALTDIDLTNIEVIGEYAFEGSLIASVDLENVTSIGERAFSGCPLTSINLGTMISVIPSDAFSSALISSLVIPDSVTTIRGRAFSGCSNLSSITFGSGINLIESNAFQNCSSLSSVDVPTGCDVQNSAFPSGVTVNFI
jgi:hypothetical protein